MFDFGGTINVQFANQHEFRSFNKILSRILIQGVKYSSLLFGMKYAL